MISEPSEDFRDEAAAELVRLRPALRGARQRRLWVCAGARDWCVDAVQRLVHIWQPESMLWLGDGAPHDSEAAAQRDYRRYLGSEYELVVLDAHAGLDVDALAAVAGTLRGGGLLVLLVPALADWARRADAQFARFAAHAARPEGHFLLRLIDGLDDPAVGLLQQGHGWRPPLPPAPAEAAAESAVAPSEQAAAVAAVLALAHARHRHRPLVLSAPRGRGKSTALGQAAAQLPAQRILVTAPGRASCETLLRHARGAGGRVPSFVPPDELLRRRPAADLLLIDEAAAIPLALLEQLVLAWPRVALATTVQGYEGTGRGFELKFFPRLDRITPGWQLLRLSEPIRWAAADPLERWLARALLLEAELLPEERLPALVPEALVYECLDPGRLSLDEALLQQLFGLLVSAHYRTRPSDLRQLLEMPSLSIHVLRQGEAVLAVALVIPEGPLPEELIPAILAGRRRVRGELIAQSLVAHAGCEAAGRLRGLRIMRIAVHPRRQGRGLGSRLLRDLTEHMQARGEADWIGASFGLDRPLLAFWEGNGYVPVRVGLRREASSGQHAVIVLRALNHSAESLLAQLRVRFHALLPLQLGDGLEALEPELARALLAAAQGPADPKAALEPRDWAELAAFACGRRGYEVSLVAIHRLLQRYEAAWMHSDVLDPGERAFLIEKCLQHHPWSQLAQTHRLDGAGMARARMREILYRLLRAVAPDRLEAERRRQSV